MEKFTAVDNRFAQIDVEKTDKIFETVKKAHVDQKKASIEFKSESVDSQKIIVDQISELSNLHRDTKQTFMSELE